MAKFDLGQAIEDFELIGRMREARKFPQLFTRQMKLNPEQLGSLFAAIAQAVAEGLSLRGAGALAGVSHRVLALWIRRAEDDVEPYASWLSLVLRRDAEVRRQTLSDLRKLSLVDAGVQRELVRQVGMPSALEKELDLLRRSKSANADAYYAPVDAAAEFKRNGTPKTEGDSQSVGLETQPADEQTKVQESHAVAAEPEAAASSNEERVCNSAVPSDEPGATR